MSAHDGRHGDALSDLLWPDPGPSERSAKEDEEVRSCEVCADELELLRRVSSELDAWGEREREAEMAAAMETEDYPGAEEASRTLAQLAEGPPARRRLSPVLPIALAVAAAAAVLLLLALSGIFSSGEAPDDGGALYVGDGLVELVAPLGEDADLGTFTWSGELPAGGSFDLSIWPFDADEFAAPSIRVEGLTEPSWTPGVGDEVPGHVRWRVRLIDAGGEAIDTASGSARD